VKLAGKLKISGEPGVRRQAGGAEEITAAARRHPAK